jgi:hypothetical protein
MTGPAGSISSVGSDGQLLYNRGGALAATGSMMFRPTGPTGPLGQATGPIGQPTLQLGAYLVPTTDATYDLGATGIQFKDVHFSGSLYNNGIPFSGGGGGVSGLTYRATGPTGPQGQATGPAPNPTLQMSAYLVPTTDATYDLGATGIRFKDEFLSGSLYMGATGARGVNILQTGLIPSHTLEDRTTGPTLNYSQTLTKPGLYTTTSIYGSSTAAGSNIAYIPKVILNSARGYATSPTALTTGDYLGAVLFNENQNIRAYVASIKSGEPEHASIQIGTTTGTQIAQIIINSTGPTGPTGQATGPIGTNIGINAHMYPITDATYNLGATGFQFKDVHFSGSLYNNGVPFSGGGGGVSGLTYRATGPTGPDGQATGPAPSPTLQVDAYLVPTTDNTYDLGATGIQFKDIHFSGTIYNNGSEFQGGVSGLTYRATGPTGPQGQPTGPTGPTLQIDAHLVPTEDLAYDLGATGLRFRDLYVGGTSIHLGDNLTLSSTNDNLTLTNQYGTNSVMEILDTRIPEINANLTSPNLGEILSVATTSNGGYISIAMKATISTVANTYIIRSTDGGVTTSIPYGPTGATGPGPIASIAVTPSGQYQVAALGPKGGLDYTGPIIRSSNYGATWATLNTEGDSTAILRKYTSISISSSGATIVATHLTSTSVTQGFVYTTNANAGSPAFSKVTSYTPPGGSFTNFAAPSFVSIDQTGSRFVIVDLVNANTTDIICFSIISGTAACLAKFRYDNASPTVKNVIVSNVTSTGFSVKYTAGSTDNWNHYIVRYIWSSTSITPFLLAGSNVIYADTTTNSITDLQLISSNDGVTQVLLPTYTSTAVSITDGIYISYDSGATWEFLDNVSNGIATSATKNVSAIALIDTGIYSFVYDSSSPYITKLYKQEFKHLYSNEIVNLKNGINGLNYVPLGPTGPTGQATGPTGPALQLSMAILPAQDLTYDLGAAGLRFRDLYVGGSSVRLGDSMSIKASGGDLTVEYQLNNNVIPNTNTSNSVTLVENIYSSLTAALIASNITDSNPGPILSVVAATSANTFNIALEAEIEGDVKNYIISSTNGGVTTSVIFEPQDITTDGQITSMALSEDATYQVAVFGGNKVGYINYSSNSGTEWGTVSTERKYTSVDVSQSGVLMAAAYTASTSPTVLAGFVYSTAFTASPPTVTAVTSYTPTGGSLTNFTAPSFATVYQSKNINADRRLIIVDVRASQSDIICFNIPFGSGTPVYVTKITFNSTDIIVSKLGQYGFSVLYKEGSANNWNHKINRYGWYYATNPDEGYPIPVLATAVIIYTDTTSVGITDLQLLYSNDGSNQVVLPTYTEDSEAITDGVYISNDTGGIWRFLSNSDQSIPAGVGYTYTLKAIALDSAGTGIYNFIYNGNSLITNLYKGILQPATFYTIKNGQDGLYYYPIENKLEITSPLIPNGDGSLNLGATGNQFNNIYFSGDLYKGGVPFSGGGGITAPTDNFIVAGGDGAGLAYSYDGTTFTSVSQEDITECTAVAWNGLIWVAGIITSAGDESIAYSSDGTIWSFSSENILSTCLAVAWNGSIWVAGGTSADGGNAIAYSYDGINWTPSPQTLIDTECNALAWNGLIWVAGGSGTNRLAYSVDGINWTASESANTEFTEGGQCNCVAWNGTTWVAGGTNDSSGGILLYSYDGVNWSPVTLDGSIVMDNYNTVAWNGSIWLAGGEGDQMFIIKSIDGIAWDMTTDRSTIAICRSITWNGTMWFAAGKGNGNEGILASSTDGLTWVPVSYTGFTTETYAVASRRVLPFVGSGNSTPGLYYRASGPTGPTGGQTGPTGPWLQVSANIVPTQDMTYDLGATGLRFRDIHVGGSTIYLGDSVSIKATNEGALTVTNNAGTVNLVTPIGLNGGILSGEGVASNGASGVYYGVETFSPPFADPPIVVVSINSASFINSKLYMAKEHLTATGCRIYSNVIDTTYNWIATARTNYPFSFYNAATPITFVSATSTSLLLTVNTNLLLRNGVQPYTAEMKSSSGDFEAIGITIDGGVQTIEVVGDIAPFAPATGYNIYISASDSSDPPVIVDSDPQTFTTGPALTEGTLAVVDGTLTYMDVQCEVVTPASGGTPPYTYSLTIDPSQPAPDVSPTTYTNTIGGIFAISSLIANTSYSISLEILDADGASASSTISFQTPYAPLNIGNSLIDTTVGDIFATPPGTYTATKITVYTDTQGVTGGSGTYTYRIAYSLTNISPTFSGSTIQSPWIDIGVSVQGANVVAFGLIASTTYYFIMYVYDTTATGLAPVFTDPVSQNTTAYIAPTVSQGTASIDSNFVSLSASITNSGSSPIVTAGMYFGTSSSIQNNPPTGGNNMPNDDSNNTASVYANYQFPAAGTYYVRGYATNEDGVTGYGPTSTGVVTA